MRTALSALLALSALVLASTPALAGERVDGHGWSLELPDGFAEAASMDGGMRVDPRFGALPVDGGVDLAAYVAGDANDPHAMLLVASVPLAQPATTVEDLGGENLEIIRAQLPDGVRVDTTTVGRWNALEIRYRPDAGWHSTTMHLLIVACGDYGVSICFLTRDDTYPTSAAAWENLKGSLEIDPPMNRWLLFGLIGIGSMLAMWLLNRFGTRQVREMPDPASRWQREGGVGEEAGLGGLAAHTPMQTGVRPKVLRSRAPAADDELAEDTRHRTPPPPAPRPMPSPAPTPTAASVTRPSAGSPTTRAGLRTTRPASGRWGH